MTTNNILLSLVKGCMFTAYILSLVLPKLVCAIATYNVTSILLQIKGEKMFTFAIK